MKLNETQIEVAVSEGLTTTNFGISLEDAPHILVILRDKLYSNKILAVIREYSTNAVDAHVEAGKPNLPIEITLPTRFEPWFRVRDFGAGLDEDGIRKIYTQYGKSTKRNSNDSIGQLGLGCKSGFAYNDSFTITSWINGRKQVYSAYIDPSGLGAITKLGDEATEDKFTGIEIALPVRTGDIQTFLTECQNVYRYFRVEPIFKNCDNFRVNFDRKAKMQREGAHGMWYVPEHNGYGNIHQSVAIMGHIGYPIVLASLPEKKPVHEHLLNCGIRINFPIGELSISANRENLEYTPATKAAIIHRLNMVLKELRESIEHNVSTAKTPFEARRIYGDLYKSQYQQSHNSFGNFMRNFMKSSQLNWQGQTIDNIAILNKEWTVHNLNGYAIVYDRGKRGDYQERMRIRKDLEKDYAIDAKFFIDFYENETDKHVLRGTTYFQSLIEALDKKKVSKTGLVLICFTGSRDNWDKFCAAQKFQPSDWVDLNTIIPPKGARIASAIKDKHSHKVFKFDASKANSALRSACWEMVETDVDEAFYVPLDHFFWEFNGNKMHGETLKLKLEELQKLGVSLKGIDIYGVKTSEIEKLSEDWATLDKKIVQEIEAFLKLKNVDQILCDHQLWLDHRVSLPSLYKEIISDLPAKSPVRKYVEHWQALEAPAGIYDKYTQLMRLYNEFTCKEESSRKLKPTHDLDAEMKAIVKDYPLLPHVGFFAKERNTAHYYVNRVLENFERCKEARSSVIEYIKLVERQ